MNGRSMLRDCRLVGLLTAEIVSGLGSWMTFLALPWFVLVTTGSPTRMGIVLAAELVPIAVLGIPSGTVVARLGARMTMLVCDLARAPLVAAVPLLHEAGLLSFPLLVSLVALTGVFSGPYFSAQRLILPELVGEDETTVARANAVVEGAQRLNQFLGPAIAGVLIAAIGAANVLYLDAATFLVSFALVTLFVPAVRAAAAERDGGDMLAGLRFFVHDAVLGPMIVVIVVSNMLGQAFVAGLPVLAYEEFDRSSRVAGAFYAASGLGAVAGSVIAYRIVTRFRPLRLAAVSSVAAALPRWLLSLGLPAQGVVGAVAASSFWNPIGNAPMLGVMTIRTPPELRAKVMTAVVTFVVLAGPVGLVAAGPLIEALGPQRFFLVIAAGMTAVSVYFAFVTLRAERVSHAARTMTPDDDDAGDSAAPPDVSTPS
ncbi:MAG: MFS transporter [Gaiellaceae bacterium]